MCEYIWSICLVFLTFIIILVIDDIRNRILIYNKNKELSSLSVKLGVTQDSYNKKKKALSLGQMENLEKIEELKNKNTNLTKEINHLKSPKRFNKPV